MVNPTNWHPFMPHGFPGLMSGAAIVFFAFIGFDAVSTTAEETRDPKRDMPIGIIASLVICTVLYVLMAAVLTGIKKYTVYTGDAAAVATAFASKPWAQALVSAGALAGTTSVLLVFQDRKSTRLNSSHLGISYAVFCLKKKTIKRMLKR